MSDCEVVGDRARQNRHREYLLMTIPDQMTPHTWDVQTLYILRPIALDRPTSHRPTPNDPLLDGIKRILIMTVIN